MKGIVIFRGGSHYICKKRKLSHSKPAEFKTEKGVINAARKMGAVKVQIIRDDGSSQFVTL